MYFGHRVGATLGMFNPVQLGSNFARNAIIRYAPLAVGLMTIEHLFRSTAPAVGLMEIENLFRYTALAVGLKPSANQGKARLRGLYRIIYSKTISPRLWNARPACAGYGGLCTQRPYALGQARRSPPAHPGMRAGRLHTQACGCDARAPRHAGATPAPPDLRRQE
jgi:hypothetical protein